MKITLKYVKSYICFATHIYIYIISLEWPYNCRTMLFSEIGYIREECSAIVYPYIIPKGYVFHKVFQCGRTFYTSHKKNIVYTKLC